jgi:cytidylate kinase
MIVTIDGPAGSGKSTAARNLAGKLKIAFLDTGATYRAATLKALREGADLEDEAELTEIARRMDLKMHPRYDGVHVFLDGRDVTNDIRSAKVTENSHYVARSSVVREVLVELQQRLGAGLGDFVAEGRDQGSVVFPDADFKFFLVANPEVRARRRHAEMVEAGQDVTYEDVLQAIVRRDGRDRSRSVAPLVKPPGSVEIDTTDNTIEQTTEELLRAVEAGR